MPLYEYECKYGHRYEKLHWRIKDGNVQAQCPECQKEGRITWGEKVHSVANPRFVGTGFYETDYKGKK